MGEVGLHPTILSEAPVAVLVIWASIAAVFVAVLIFTHTPLHSARSSAAH